MNLDKNERKVMLCPFCGVELKEHPASRYMFLIVLIIIAIFNVNFESDIKTLFGEFYHIAHFCILSFIAIFGVFIMWILGYTLVQEK